MQMVKQAQAVCVIVAFGGACSMSIASVDEAAFLDAEAIIVGWKAHYGGINRMHFRVSEKVIDGAEGKDNPFTRNRLIRFHAVDMTVDKATNRFHMKYSREKGGLDEPLNLYELAFDGKVTRQYWGDGPRKRGRIAAGLRGHPENTAEILDQYLLHFDIGCKQEDGKFKWVPFMDYLSDLSERGDKRIMVKDDLETVANELCHVVEVGDEGSPTNRLWFSHNKGMLPMRHQVLSGGEVVKEMIVLDTAKSSTDTGVTWYPAKAHLSKPASTLDDSGNAWRETLTYELEVLAFTPNIEVGEGIFRFDFPTGTEVIDEIGGGARYTVGSAGLGSLDVLAEQEVLQSPMAVESEVASEGDSDGVAETVSTGNILGQESQATTSRAVGVKTMLWGTALACTLLVSAILLKYGRADKNGTVPRVF